MVPQDFGTGCPLYSAIKVFNENDVPSTIPRGLVFIVGSKGQEELAVLSCPCGCGDRLRLNLIKASKPNWSWLIDIDKTVTFCPSINRLTGCKSHFFLTEGRVQWCGRSEIVGL